MRPVVSSCLLALLLAHAAPAAAQDLATKAQPDEIVVTGTKEAQRARQVREFVNAISGTQGAAQFKRFETALCPLVVGLSPGENAAVTRRLKRLASVIGMRIADARCRPNLLVAVVSGKNQFLDGLLKKQPSLFAMMSPAQVRRLLRDQRQVTAWQQTGQIGANGLDLNEDAAFDIYVNRVVGIGPLTTPPARFHTKAAVVVIEAGASLGLTTTQLADYAAMRGFADTDPSSVPAWAPSILTSVGAPPGTAVPITLTEWDLGFLRGLYSGSIDAPKVVRRQEVGRTVIRELDRQQPGDGRQK